MRPLRPSDTPETQNKHTMLGEASNNHADSEEENASTQKRLDDDDEAFFEDAKEQRKAKVDAWTERSWHRKEELAGINKAIEILTSDETTATFGHARGTEQADHARGGPE